MPQKVSFLLTGTWSRYLISDFLLFFHLTEIYWRFRKYLFFSFTGLQIFSASWDGNGFSSPSRPSQNGSCGCCLSQEVYIRYWQQSENTWVQWNRSGPTSWSDTFCTGFESSDVCWSTRSISFSLRKYGTSSVCHSSKPTWLHGLFYPDSTHRLQEPSLDALCWREWVARAVGRLCPAPWLHRGLPEAPLPAQLSLPPASAVQPAGQPAPQPGAGPAGLHRRFPAEPDRQRPLWRAAHQHLHGCPRQGDQRRSGQTGQEANRYVWVPGLVSSVHSICNLQPGVAKKATPLIFSYKLPVNCAKAMAF